MNDAAFRRFFAKVEIDETTGCWRWTGAKSSGYGRFQVDGRRIVEGVRVKRPSAVQAHRLSYEHFIGPIFLPQLDHLCRNRDCVNPWHGEPVTNQENSRRGAKGVLVTVCKHGHGYTLGNTGWHSRPTGARRYCRTCERELRLGRYAAGYRAPERRPVAARGGGLL